MLSSGKARSCLQMGLSHSGVTALSRCKANGLHRIGIRFVWTLVQLHHVALLGIKKVSPCIYSNLPQIVCINNGPSFKETELGAPLFQVQLDQFNQGAVWITTDSNIRETTDTLRRL